MQRGELGSGVQYFPQVPPALRVVLLRSMGPFPEERYASIAELRAELRRFLEAAGGAPPAPPPVASAEPPLPREGMPRRGPGDRYNSCERVWCLVHDANFDLDHFTRGHNGWILHDDGHGDVFVPRHRTSGPEFPKARHNVLLLCGQHVHPYWLGGRRGPVTRTGYNVALGYARAHFRVGIAHGACDIGERQAEANEPVRIDDDLILTFETAEGGHFGHTRH